MEEMKDNIRIDIYPEYITIQYESEYFGQIAPHIRNMIDVNSDTILTKEEVSNFFTEYKISINKTLQNLPLLIGKDQFTINLVDIFASTLLTDSLLAPFRVGALFVVNDLKIEQGEHELVIDPKLLFQEGNHFIKMAKERVEFNNEQESAIGHYLQLTVFASEPLQFISTYPGRIKKDKKTVYIFGVFYDETILRINNSDYPKIRIKLKTPPAPK
ncbi:hypothetical protein KKC74_00240 [bacterium]|nr:hypothetical protein [bacterium]